jgi:hypothetical protein
MKKLFFLLIFVLLIGFVNANVNYCNNFQMISLNNTSNEKPALFDDIVVWSSNGNIVSYDISKDILRNVTSGYWWKQSADIFGNYIVWVGFEPDSQIYYCDINLNGAIGGCLENDDKIKVTNSFALKRDIVIFDSKLVWSEFDGSDFEIVGCDINLNGAIGGCLENDDKIWLTSNDFDDLDADIFGRYVVWESLENDWNIYYYDILNRNLNNFIDSNLNQRNPKLLKIGREYYVVYWSNEFGNDDVLYKKIGGFEEILLTNGTGFDEWNPSVNNFGENKILWQSSKFGVSNLEGISRTGFIDANYVGNLQKNVEIYENLIVFEKYGSGSSDIFIGFC